MVKLVNKKINFHVHTKYSNDSFLKPTDIVDILYNKNFNVVIITDHNSIDGAIEAKKYAEKKYKKIFSVIIGEEIKTDIGDIIGFPVKKYIRPNDYNTVIKDLKKQKSKIVLPHPYISNISKIKKANIIKRVDFVETFNSRVSNKKNKLAKKLAQKYNIKEIIGSDTHIKNELGNTSFKFDDNYNLIDCFKCRSTQKNIRLSQIIYSYKNKKIKKYIKYLILYIINK